MSISKKRKCLKCTYRLNDKNYRVDMLFALYTTVSGITLSGFKSIGHL